MSTTNLSPVENFMRRSTTKDLLDVKTVSLRHNVKEKHCIVRYQDYSL